MRLFTPKFAKNQATLANICLKLHTQNIFLEYRLNHILSSISYNIESRIACESDLKEKFLVLKIKPYCCSCSKTANKYIEEYILLIGEILEELGFFVVIQNNNKTSLRRNVSFKYQLLIDLGV